MKDGQFKYHARFPDVKLTCALIVNLFLMVSAWVWKRVSIIQLFDTRGLGKLILTTTISGRLVTESMQAVPPM